MIITCSECGKKTNSGNGICEHCGVEIKLCSECGNVLKDGATVCDYCGCSCEDMISMQDSISEKETVEKLREIYDYSKKIEKVLNWSARLLFLSVAILFAIGYWKHATVEWSLVRDGLFYKVEHNIGDVKFYMVLGLIIGLVWLLFISLKEILFYSIIASKIDQVNFDYRNFIKNVKLYEMDNSANFVESDNGTIIKVAKDKYCSIDEPIIYSMNYKMNATETVLYLLKRAVVFIFWAATLICLYLLVVVNNDKLIQEYESYSILISSLAPNQTITVSFGADLSYKPYAIVCVVCFFVGYILQFIFNKAEIKSNRNWFRNTMKTK